MRKADLIAAVVDIADLSEHQADEVVSSTFEHITNALARGETFNLVGFGSFKVKNRATRVGRNPQTGDSIEIAAHRQVTFRPGKLLKDSLR